MVMSNAEEEEESTRCASHFLFHSLTLSFADEQWLWSPRGQLRLSSAEEEQEKVGCNRTVVAEERELTQHVCSQLPERVNPGCAGSPPASGQKEEPQLRRCLRQGGSGGGSCFDFCCCSATSRATCIQRFCDCPHLKEKKSCCFQKSQQGDHGNEEKV